MSINAQPNSKDIIAENTQATTTVLEADTRATVKLTDLSNFIPAVKTLLKNNIQLDQVVSFKELTQRLIQPNLNLTDITVKINPVVGTTATITEIQLPTDSPYLGMNSISVQMSPLENKVIDMLTPQMLSEDGLIISPSDSYCGIHQVTIKDIALSSNNTFIVIPTDEQRLDAKQINLQTNQDGDFITLDFETSDYFGAKDCTIEIPLVDEHIFTIDSSLDLENAAYTPANVAQNTDGTGGNAGKLGFKSVGLRVALDKTTYKTPQVIINKANSSDANTGKKGGKLYPSTANAPIAIESVTLPVTKSAIIPFEDISTALNNNSTSLILTSNKLLTRRYIKDFNGATAGISGLKIEVSNTKSLLPANSVTNNATKFISKALSISEKNQTDYTRVRLTLDIESSTTTVYKYYLDNRYRILDSDQSGHENCLINKVLIPLPQAKKVTFDLNDLISYSRRHTYDTNTKAITQIIDENITASGYLADIHNIKSNFDNLMIDYALTYNLKPHAAAIKLNLDTIAKALNVTSYTDSTKSAEYLIESFGAYDFNSYADSPDPTLNPAERTTAMFMYGINNVSISSNQNKFIPLTSYNGTRLNHNACLGAITLKVPPPSTKDTNSVKSLLYITASTNTNDNYIFDIRPQGTNSIIPQNITTSSGSTRQYYIITIPSSSTTEVNPTTLASIYVTCLNNDRGTITLGTSDILDPSPDGITYINYDYDFSNSDRVPIKIEILSNGYVTCNTDTLYTKLYDDNILNADNIYIDTNYSGSKQSLTGKPIFIQLYGS